MPLENGQRRRRMGLAAWMLIAAIAFAACIGDALADELQYDGDTVAAGTQVSEDLGDRAPGEEFDHTIGVRLICDTRRHADRGTTVTVSMKTSASSIPGDGAMTMSSVVFTIPSTWPLDSSGGGTNCSTPPQALSSTSTVSITAPTTAGTHTYELAIERALSSGTAGDVKDPNPSKLTFTLNVVSPSDTTAPSITCPAGQTLEGNRTGGYTGAIDEASATDNADPPPAVTRTPSGDDFELGLTPVTWTATDTSSNSAQCSADVTVVDTTAPGVSAPADLNVEGNTTGGWTGALGSATASDIVDAAPVITNDAPALFPLGTTVVTWTATDASGNSATATQSVTVVDTTAPSITCPANVTGIVGQPVVLGTATATDVVDPAPYVSYAAPPTFGPGTTIVTWSATDSSINTATCGQSVTMTYVFAGFLSPVDNPPVVNVARAGSTIPLKWQLKDYAGAYITNTATVTSIVSYRTDCVSSAASDEIETTATGGTVLRYDFVSNQFIYNWGTTKAWSGTCRTLVLTLDDGTTHTAMFKFR